MKKIILATTSKPRIDAFGFLSIPFQAEGSVVDEYAADRPGSPRALVQYFARKKAEAVALRHKGEEAIILGFDSVAVAYFNGRILEKPKSRQEAFERLEKLSGDTHHFYTGICLIELPQGKFIVDAAETECRLRRITTDEIDKYLNSDPNYMKYALGYDPLGNFSASFIKNINGNPHNILRGLPLDVIVEMLKETEK